MNISPELLKKYAAGTCSEEERRRVERWLADDNLSASSPLSTFAAERTRGWNSISQTIGHSQAKVLPVHKKVVRYLAAACFLFGLLNAGYWVSVHEFGYDDRTASTEPEGYVLVLTGSGKSEKVTDQVCEIEFQGIVQLQNTSTTRKTVRCHGERLDLEPHQIYHLTKPHQELVIKRINNFIIAPTYSPYQTSNFSVKCVQA
ncbi:hypothetical protein [Tunicatimonas pelagia]|uniref:hypothetical protein n=1 Tax=Tunicatimonas pelagia TaxID=931531 RepID=UPI0026670B2E|nr:hypothetical protein [Tunicatimonas pelagia]WKN42974.1 hypothetical protein P0M28_28450 [Tunicatimonas pelagia]